MDIDKDEILSHKKSVYKSFSLIVSLDFIAAL